MKIMMHEILQKISNAKTKAQKIKMLREYNSQGLRAILIANFDESVISMLPEGEPPFKKNEAPEGTEHTILEREARLLHHFFKGGSNISKTKRETMFIQMLEGLHHSEANVLILAKDKKIGKRWKITRQCVEEAFPTITWGNRS